MPLMTRRAQDLGDVLAYGDAVEQLDNGSRIVSIHQEGIHKYENALEPHVTFRVWIQVKSQSNMDWIDEKYSELTGFDNED